MRSSVGPQTVCRSVRPNRVPATAVARKDASASATVSQYRTAIGQLAFA